MSHGNTYTQAHAIVKRLVYRDKHNVLPSEYGQLVPHLHMSRDM